MSSIVLPLFIRIYVSEASEDCYASYLALLRKIYLDVHLQRFSTSQDNICYLFYEEARQVTNNETFVIIGHVSSSEFGIHCSKYLSLVYELPCDVCCSL